MPKLKPKLPLLTTVRTELDISLSPLFEHILALYEHEHARDQERREAVSCEFVAC
jgi:hypothetical protein